MADVLTIILGGGKGTRLYPLTKYRSKPAVPIGGKYRLIDIPLSNCVHSGFYSVYVLTQFMSVSLNRHIALAYSFDHLRRGFVDTIPAVQSESDGSDWFLGTADAVRKSMMHFHQHHFDDFLILSGDHLYRMDYRKMWKVHRKNHADVTVATLPVPETRIGDFGIMKVDSKDRITDFVEKPEDVSAVADFRVTDQKKEKQPAYLASMGIYIFRRKILRKLLDLCDGNDFGYNIVPYAIQHNRTFVYKHYGYWEDIGKIDDFYRANIRLTEPKPPFNFYDAKRPVFTRPRHLPGSLLDRADVKNAIICEGSVINRASISHSVIGIRSIINKGSRLKRILMMGADFYEEEGYFPELKGSEIPPIGIGKDCEISNTIIEKNARVGSGVIIKSKPSHENYDSDGYVVRNGITVIEKNAVIPSGTVI